MPREDPADASGIDRLETELREQKELTARLVAENDRLAVTLRCIGEGVVTTDLAGRVILMNDVAEAMSGWARVAAEGRPLDEVLPLIGRYTHTPCGHPVDEVVRTGHLAEGRRVSIPRADGSLQLVERSGTPILDSDGRPTGVVWVLRDVTETVRLSRERQKAKQLESIGVLAGGIAHDFNNILTAVSANISLAQLAPGLDEETSKWLQEAQRACRRAAALTHQLLTFAKGGAPVKVVASISELIRDCTVFALRGSTAACEFHIAEDLWDVDADIGQIGQVIHNLVINAQQAMPDGGTIHVRAANALLDEGAARHVTLDAGRYVVVSFADQGVGIPEENLIRIFDPYFTTKARGNGLGLATVYSIIKAHDGHIAVESAPGSGTRFTIYIPAATAPASSPAAASKARLSGCPAVF